MGSKSCNHVSDINDTVLPKTEGCEECEKDGTDWVALRLCLTCGHVGCCESSVGRHAERHFSDTGHPIMIALPNKAWKWCYIHKTYP
ncbi:MAG: UBP-type zinc finger domain-containing protein [Nitrososphaerales archaeon]